MNIHLKVIRNVTFIFIILLFSSVVNGQNNKIKVADKEASATEDFNISAVRLYDLDNNTNPKKHYLSIILNKPQDDDPNKQLSDFNPANILIKFLPSGKVVPIIEINGTPSGDPNRPNTKNLGDTEDEKFLQIGLSDDPSTRPEPGDDKVEVTFNKFHFKEDNKVVVKKISGTGLIYNRGNIDKRVEETRQALKEAVASAKTTEEKNFFTDFNVVVPSEGGRTEGNTDIIINRNLVPQNLGQAKIFDEINVGLQLRKATENEADPRHFTAGLTFRKTFLRASKSKLNNIKQAISGGVVDEAAERTVLNDIGDLQKNFVRAFFFDNALRFEADVSNRGISNVSNLLYDGNLQIATVSKAFAGRTGFFNFRFLPAGIEVGSNLTNGDNPDLAKKSLARFKIGGEMNLTFKSDNPKDFISRVTLSGKGLNRYLFRNENVFDDATQKVISIDKGNKYWLQSDLKVITGFNAGFGRVGFKATYTNGSLPPVYSFVRSFKFGLVFETDDDDNSENIKP